MNINLNLYKYFYEVARLNSFTKAAESLCISQPSLSYSVKTLEDQLNTKLFIRTNNKLELTADGIKLYEDLGEILSKFDNIGKNDSMTGKINIGVRPMVAIHGGPPLVHSMNLAYPELEIIFKGRSKEELYEGLLNHNFDLIIDEYDYSNNLIESYKYDSGYKTTIIIYKEYKDLVDTIDLDFLNNNEIYIAKLSNYNDEMRKLYPNAKFKVFESSPLMFEEMKDNKVIGFTNTVVAEDLIKSGEFVEVKTNISLPETNSFISVLKSNKNKKTKAIIDLVINYKK